MEALPMGSTDRNGKKERERERENVGEDRHH